MSRVNVRPDPRISTLRPGWLADDAEWSGQLQSMQTADVDWIETHWEKAGGAPAEVDTSWVRTEMIRSSSGLPLGLLAVAVVLSPLLLLIGAK